MKKFLVGLLVVALVVAAIGAFYYKDNSDTASADLAVAQAAAAEKDTALAEAQAAADEKEAALTEAQAAADEKDAALTEAQAAITDLEAQLAEATAAGEAAATAQAEELKKLQDEQIAAAAKNESLSGELAEAQAQIDELSAQAEYTAFPEAGFEVALPEGAEATLDGTTLVITLADGGIVNLRATGKGFVVSADGANIEAINQIVALARLIG